MDQPGKPFTSEGGETRNWIGRLIVAVLLGEALWGLIVSVMNHVVVPWLGDVMGPSSGLPTSFTQRPYNYPEVFVSVFEFCIAGLVAAVINYFFQGPGARRVKTLKSSAPAGPVRVVPQPATFAVPARTAPPPVGLRPDTAPTAPVPVAKADPVVSSAPLATGPAAPAPAIVPAARPAAVASPAPTVAGPAAVKPQPPAPKAEPAKPKKPKNVYYNIVGEPMPSDDD